MRTAATLGCIALLAMACSTTTNDADVPDATTPSFDASIEVGTDAPSIDAGDATDDTTDARADAADARTDVAADAIDETADAAADAVDETADAGADAVDDTTDAGTDAIDETADAAADAVDETTDAGTDAVDETADAGADAVDETSDAAADAVDETADAGDAAAEPDAPALPYAPLVQGLTYPRRIAVGGGVVYWFDGGDSAVGVISTSGGKVQLIPASGTVVFVWADAARAYWVTQSGEVWARAHGGATPLKLGTQLGLAPRAMTSDATYVYWADSNDDHVRRLAVDGSSSAPEAFGPTVTSPGGVALAGGKAYVAEAWNFGSIDAFVPTDTAVTTLVPAGSLYNNQPALIQTDGTNLFWVESPRSGSATIEGCRLDGTGLFRYSSAASWPQLASDGSNVYWTSGTTDLSVVRSTAGVFFGATTVYSHLPFAATSLAVDATSLYWNDTAGGAIYRADK